MLYQRKSFSVASRNLSTSMCKEKGHSGADSRGCCYACGEKITPPARGLEAIVPGANVRVDGPASSIETRDEMVNLEGGPTGDLSAPLSSLRRLAHTDLYAMDFGTQVLWYRAIGLETDSPRVLAFDGFARTP